MLFSLMPHFILDRLTKLLTKYLAAIITITMNTIISVCSYVHSCFPYGSIIESSNTNGRVRSNKNIKICFAQLKKYKIFIAHVFGTL